MSKQLGNLFGTALKIRKKIILTISSKLNLLSADEVIASTKLGSIEAPLAVFASTVNRYF